MKIKNTAVTAALVASLSSCMAFAPPRVSTKSLSAATRPFGTLMNSVITEEVTPTTPPLSLEPTGKSIADGTIVSYFKGGLAAIQISDDLELPSSTSTDMSSSLFSGPPPMETKAGNGQGDNLLGRQAVFSNGSVGVVVAQRFPIAFVLTDKEIDNVDGTVTVLDSMACVNVSDKGAKIVDCFGQSLDEGEVSPDDDKASLKRAMFAPIPRVSDISLINSPLLTGTTMVDALSPLGKGQNMLVVGTCYNEMRGFASDVLTTQQRSCPNTKLIYAVTEHCDEILQKLKEAGVLEHVTVVASRELEEETEVARAAEATAVAAAACAIGEAYALEGKDALVIVDNIDQHKILWDATTRVMVDVYGVDAVVQADREGGASSEMRAFYSSLVQRAGKFKRGNGSMTLAMLTSIPSDNDDDDHETVFEPSDFEQTSDKVKARLDILVKKKIPLTAANLKKIDIPVPSDSEGHRRMALQHVVDLISMSDGQIWFDQKLAAEGQSPPLDPQRSITRVGIGAYTESRADAPAMRRVVGGLRLDLAQALAMEGAEATAASKRQERKRNAWLLAMYQVDGQGGRDLSESCVALLAASMGALDDTVEKGGLGGTQEGQSVIDALLEHVKTNNPDAMKEIDDTLDMTPDVQGQLESAINSFFS